MTRIFCRVKGPTDKVRELSAILDYNFHYNVIFGRDVLELGYKVASIPHKEREKKEADRVPYVIDLRGILRGSIVTLKEVSLGTFVFKNVDAILLELDIPQFVPVDLILGRPFFDNFRFELDLNEKSLQLTPHG